MPFHAIRRRHATKVRLAAVLLTVMGAVTVAPAADVSSVPMVAASLVRADHAAAASGERHILGAELLALDRQGVHAIDRTDDPLPAWRRRAGAERLPDRGRVLGPGFSRGWLSPGGAISTTQQFFAGQPSHVAVAGNPGARLDVSVSDEERGVVCRGGAVCAWSPMYTARYTIVVQNQGRERVRFYLVVD